MPEIPSNPIIHRMKSMVSGGEIPSKAGRQGTGQEPRQGHHLAARLSISGQLQDVGLLLQLGHPFFSGFLMVFFLEFTHQKWGDQKKKIHHLC